MANATSASKSTTPRTARFAATPDGYLAYQSQPGKRFTKGTRDKYEPQIRAYHDYCCENEVELAEQDEFFIEQEWFAVADEVFVTRYGSQPSVSYVRNRYCALKSYFAFLKKIRAVADNPVELIDAPIVQYGEVDWLTEAEDEALASVDMNPLEEILWALTRVGGLRISEVPYLLDEDGDLLAGELHICDGKTRSAKRDVHILPRLYPAIERWRAHRDEVYGKPAPGASFIRTGRARNDETDERPHHISTVYIDRIIKRVATRAGVRLHRDKRGNAIALDKGGHNTSAVSAHTLRRTYGSDLLNRGVPIEVVSEQLGHARIGITQQAYARLLKRTVRQKVLCAVDSGVASAGAARQGVDLSAMSDADTRTRAQQLCELEALEAAIAAQRRALLAA